MQALLSSDLILVAFSLLLGGMVGMFWERARQDRDRGPSAGDSKAGNKD